MRPGKGRRRLPDPGQNSPADGLAVFAIAGNHRLFLENTEHLEEPPDRKHDQTLGAGNGDYGAKRIEKLTGIHGVANEAIGSASLEAAVGGGDAKAASETNESPEPN